MNERKSKTSVVLVGILICFGFPNLKEMILNRDILVAIWIRWSNLEHDVVSFGLWNLVDKFYLGVYRNNRNPGDASASKNGDSRLILCQGTDGRDGVSHTNASNTCHGATLSLSMSWVTDGMLSSVTVAKLQWICSYESQSELGELTKCTFDFPTSDQCGLG